MTPWPDSVAPVPIALLAWKLLHEYEYESPPHLAVEAMARSIADEYALTPPVTFEDAAGLLRGLDLLVNPTWVPRLTAGHSGNNSGLIELGKWIITTRERDAETRQTLTLFHELYEVLRKYFHHFDCAPFPEGMKPGDFVPERLARRFSAAITMPRSFVSDFIREHGLHIPLLLAETQRSQGCVARRLCELFEEPDFFGREVPFLAVRCALQKRLMTEEPPQFKCAEQVRSRHLSLRRNRRGARSFHFPRAKEHWQVGEFLGGVLGTGEPAFVHRARGNSLFGDRDLCALAVPEWEDEAVSAIAVYATLVQDSELWAPAVAEMRCRTIERVDDLFGAPVEILRPSGLGTELFDERTALIGSAKKLVEFYRRHRPSPPGEEEPDEPRPFLWFSNIGLRLDLGTNGQLEWVYDHLGDEEWRLDSAIISAPDEGARRRTG